MSLPKIRQVRAFVVRGGGAGYHDQSDGHRIDDHIATPMSRYPEYRRSRQGFGINVLGTLVVFAPQLLGEPVPQNGRMPVSALDKPGFGVELNRAIKLARPYTH